MTIIKAKPKKPIKKHPSEDTIQRACVAWFDSTYPEFSKCLFHVNNNSSNDFEGARMKKKGVRAGVPDLVFVMRKKVYFIELKTKIGTTSTEQDAVHKLYKLLGHQVVIIRSIDEFKAFIKSNMLSMTARIILYARKMLNL